MLLCADHNKNPYLLWIIGISEATMHYGLVPLLRVIMQQIHEDGHFSLDRHAAAFIKWCYMCRIQSFSSLLVYSSQSFEAWMVGNYNKKEDDK